MNEEHIVPLFSTEPDLMLPFTIDREQAARIFLREFSVNKMTPVEFIDSVHHNRFEQTYFPAYLIDCNITSSVTAVCTKRHENQISKYRTQHTVKTHVSEILANASDITDDFLINLLEPYELDNAVAFSREAAGEVTYTSPDISAESVFEKIKPEAEMLAQQAAENSLNKYTDKATESCIHSFSDISARQILLPVWVLECTYGGRPYRIFVNGQTGRVAGIPPRSKKKAAAIISSAAAIGAAAAQLIWMAVKLL